MHQIIRKILKSVHSIPELSLRHQEEGKLERLRIDSTHAC